jgi:hypothetical protein
MSELEPDGPSPWRDLNLQLWAAQAVLALSVGASGLAKVTLPAELLAAQPPWLAGLSHTALKGLGLAELGLAFFVVAPALTRIYPLVTPATAALTGLAMAVLSAVQLAHGAPRQALFGLALVAISAFVAWGRAGKSRIEGHAYLR